MQPTLQQDVKRDSRPSIASIAAGSLTFHDATSNRSFLVDTGAEVSVLPATTEERLKPPMLRELVAANGSTIKCYGERTLHIHVGTRTYVWKFLVAAVKRALLGADFLTHSSLLVDVKNRQLVHPTEFSTSPLQRTRRPPTVTGLALVAAEDKSKLSQLFSEFKSITRPKFDVLEPKHKVRHVIETTGQPIRAKARPLAPGKLAAAKAEFANMQRLGIIRRSNSPWSSPLHVVPKDDGSFRPCRDYRRLNAVTVPDRYSMPLVTDLTARLFGRRFFGKVDLIRGYHQVPVAPEDVPKTALATPFGNFEFLRMPFGLKNAGQTFQRLMDGVLGDLEFVFVYMDDILVASNTLEEHEEHFRVLFQRLADHDLIVNPGKCSYGQTSLEFLGHNVSRAGIRPLKDKVEAIENFPVPTSLPELQRFLGMVNYYRRFIPGAASTMAPLHAATAGNPKASSFQWSAELDGAFKATKAALAKATLLHHPRLNAEISIATDASAVAVGAVLQQRPREGGQWEPIAYFSKKLRQPELKYSAFDRELLGLYLGIRHFRHYLEGRDFPAFTDHKPLTFAMAKVSEPWSARQARHLEYISQYTTDIRHVAGAENAVADALSRAAVSEVRNGVDFTAMADQQQEDPETEAYRTSITGLRWESIPVDGGRRTLLCDVSTGSPRPLVPAALRRQVFDTIHNLSHPGANATVRLMKSKFVWHGLAKDVRKWARACFECQRAKVHRHVRAPLTKFEPPANRFTHVHVDLVGPLPMSEGHTHLLTVIDRFTRWPEAIPLRSTDTSSIARAFALSWIARHGIPADITSDRGVQFTSRLWHAMSELLGSKLHPTTAYHPQANGLVERFHRSLKAALMARLTSTNWMDELPWVLLGLRATPKDDIGTSVAEMLYGTPLTVPGALITHEHEPDPSRQLERLREIAGHLVPAPDAWHGSRNSTVPASLQAAEFVFIRRDTPHRPLQPPYTGPYKVLEKKPKFFKIQCGTRTETVSIDRLKPANTDPEQQVKPAQPPPRGRPPRAAPSPSALTTPTTVGPNRPDEDREPNTRTTRSGRTSRRPARFR